MADSSATLSSLIAAPNPDNPRGVGYMTDSELLTGRPNIDRRGMMVSEQLLCSTLPRIPVSIMPGPAPMPGITEREFHDQGIANPSCKACHVMLDPLGHAFGHFDRQGIYRDLDNGQPVDASDVFEIGDSAFKFSGIEDLTLQMSESCEVARCVARSLLREAIDPELPSNVDPPFTDEDVAPVATRFVDSNFSLRALFRAIVESPVFLR
jgi:hypothetical protein